MSTSRQKSKAPWDLELRFLKGVGDKLSELFAKEDIHTLWDLLLFLPRTYEDRRKIMDFASLQVAAQSEQVATAFGIIESYNKRSIGPRRSIQEALVRVLDPDQKNIDMLDPVSAKDIFSPHITFTWFSDPGNQIQKRFPVGSHVLFRGKAQIYRSRIQITHPELQRSDSEMPDWENGHWIPIYREISGLSTRVIRKIIALALQREELKEIPELLSYELRKKLELPDFLPSLRELHFPKHWDPEGEDLRPGGKYLVRVAFEELFMMALSMQMRKQQWRNENRRQIKRLAKITESLETLKPEITKLPFKLTAAQAHALEDVLKDMACVEQEGPMHRLVQGDVGSGKTMVAFLSALAAMKAGYQVALMAPTELLANQHYQNFGKFFPELAHDCLLLKGALKAKEKKEVRQALSSGRVRFVIGTQALLTEDTLFDRLGLIIVDEQHRFGVRQRITLKGHTDEILPHLLVMTATPIPRSLALTIYGDLNLSLIKEKPAGRIPIETHLLKRRQHDALVKRLKQFLAEGRQIYLVYPLVEESEEMDLKDVQNAYLEWCQEFGKEGVALLHGRMKGAQKDEVMRAFKNGETRVLVSTTVIEVGVDVPNASVIVIEHAERFGLSQLHQLRGRVGRGAQKSYCVLVGPDRPGPLVEERLRVMESSEDGFYIAEKDLEIRGPGEFLGRRQSGLPGFRVAHITRDVELLELARKEADFVLSKDPELSKPENQNLKKMLHLWWSSRAELTQAG